MNPPDEIGKFLWSERYRPQTLDECILPDRIRNTIQKFIDDGQIPSLLLDGRSGMGKTTLARVICNELDATMMFINASEERNIDVLRNKIRDFASTRSIEGDSDVKIVILDEADNLNETSTQPALRGFIEEFSDSCRFILTCNHKNRILDALRSRCVEIDFTITGKEKSSMMAQTAKRITLMLRNEGIENVSMPVVVALVRKKFPDIRRMINLCQQYTRNGSIDEGILTATGNESIDELVDLLRSKKFNEVRKWLVEHESMDPNSLFRSLYDSLFESLKPSSLPVAILKIAEYQDKATRVVDQEINTFACLIEIMAECDFV